jgi:hypothetical protein
MNFLIHARTVCICLAIVCSSSCRAPAVPSELRIISDEYGYHMPDSVSAGVVHITLRNAGRDVHEALLVRFTDSTGTAAAYADSVRAHVDFPSNARDVGGPGLTLPGESSGVWLRLAPGRYAIVCWKGDHLVRGMVHELRVVETGRPSADPPPATYQLTLQARDVHGVSNSLGQHRIAGLRLIAGAGGARSRSTFVLQRLRRLNAKRPSRRNDAGE